MYLIEKGQLLTAEIITKIINSFSLNELPKLIKYKDYFEGKQEITRREATDTGKPNNRVVVNFCNSIVNNYLGYLTGKPISYSNDTTDFEEVINVLRYNDTPDEDSELLRQALIYGKAFEICYIDMDGKQRFKVLDSKECIPVYDNTIDSNLKYVIRFYKDTLYRESVSEQEEYIVEIYSETDVSTYKASEGFSSLSFISKVPHYYKQVPITVFTLNKDEESIFSQVISLQDAYNTVLSDNLNDYETFADAYMVIKGMTADDDDLDTMKTHRVLLMDSDASAEYLTKNFSDAQTQNILTTINKKIHSIANSPDFTDETFMAESGIALRYKLVGFENTASGIENQMKKALTKRIELLSEILKLTDNEIIWADVNIQFTRNLPTDLTESVNLVSALQGIVSDETLLSLLPFVNDPATEVEKLKQQKKENVNLFDFSLSRNIEGAENEDEESTL